MFPWSPKPNKENEEKAQPPRQLAPAPGFHSPSTDTTALVTGACGLCGARLIEMLLERGTKTIIAFDIAVPDPTLQERFMKIQQQTGGTILECFGRERGDITSDTAVQNAFSLVSPIHIVYHIAALVGPFFDRQLYFDVNYHGTIRIIDQCRQHAISQLVYSSSPGHDSRESMSKDCKKRIYPSRPHSWRHMPKQRRWGKWKSPRRVMSRRYGPFRLRHIKFMVRTILYFWPNFWKSVAMIDYGFLVPDSIKSVSVMSIIIVMD